MTAPYANVAYAAMTADYDTDRFVYEYDRYILPRSRPIYNGRRDIANTIEINRSWGMIDTKAYELQPGANYHSYAESLTAEAPTNTSKTISWLQAIMTQLVPDDKDDDLLRKIGNHGGLPARNFAPDRPWQLKPEFAKLNLSIVDFIYNRLCLTRVVWISCVSLEPGRCAVIHRDSMRLYTEGSNPLRNNGLAQRGYVVIVLNITNGGVPMYWALDHDLDRPYFADDKIYISSDYFLHGVPVVSSRRRQVRIMGVPGPGFDSLVDLNRSISVPQDYQYLNQGASMY